MHCDGRACLPFAHDEATYCIRWMFMYTNYICIHAFCSIGNYNVTSGHARIAVCNDIIFSVSLHAAD